MTIDFKVAGETSASLPKIPKGKAGAAVTFSRENAVVFRVSDATEHRIADSIGLGRAILKLFEEGAWDEDFVVVTHLIRAMGTTVLISSSRQARIEIGASASITTGNVDLADVNAKLRVAYAKDIATQFIAERNVTPLFRAMRVKDDWLGRDVGELRVDEEIMEGVDFEKQWNKSAVA